ncbi:MAG: Rpn family recombination-promoting nuclease/putative transposase [Gammaproteobacteria bacterium SHHR-1]
MSQLLDPTNDYVFKRLFAESPELLLALINDLRPDLPPITSVEVLNPGIAANELSGKYIILDVLARDAEGNRYNLEIQVRRYNAWNRRGLFYLARALGSQLFEGEDYSQLRASVGLHLLDFDLFTQTEAERQQAIWRFEMRDENQPQVSLGNILQLNLIELRKAERLGLTPGPLAAWVTFFKHGQEEATMSKVQHEPVQAAMSRIRQLSADEEARRLAFVRERALRDEASLLKDAREEGLQVGREEGLQVGREEGLQVGLQKGRQEMLRQLLELKFGTLPDWVENHLSQASDSQLQDWTGRIFTAESLEGLLGRH